MRKLVIALVVLAALFVAADRVLVSAAESVVARRVQVAAELETEPTVQIRGFPFLTQAVRGNYRQIDISLTALERGDVRLENLVAHLDDVDAPLSQMLRQDGSATVRADSAKAAAVVPYEVIEERLPRGIQAEPRGDRLRLRGEIDVLGQTQPVTAVVGVEASQGTLAFDAMRVRVGGRAVPGSLAERFSFEVEVGELPFGLRITGAEATGEGVRVTAVGQDVLLTGPGGTATASSPFRR